MKLRLQIQLYALSLCVLLMCLSCFSCGSVTVRFDPEAVQRAVQLKDQALGMVDRANESYQYWETDIREIISQLEMAQRLAAELAENQLVAKQWQILRDPEKHLLGGFLRLWQEKGHLPDVFIREAKLSIALAFDEIIRLASGSKGNDSPSLPNQ